MTRQLKFCRSCRNLFSAASEKMLCADCRSSQLTYDGARLSTPRLQRLSSSKSDIVYGGDESSLKQSLSAGLGNESDVVYLDSDEDHCDNGRTNTINGTKETSTTLKNATSDVRRKSVISPKLPRFRKPSRVLPQQEVSKANEEQATGTNESRRPSVAAGNDIPRVDQSQHYGTHTRANTLQNAEESLSCDGPLALKKRKFAENGSSIANPCVINVAPQHRGVGNENKSGCGPASSLSFDNARDATDIMSFCHNDDFVSETASSCGSDTGVLEQGPYTQKIMSSALSKEEACMALGTQKETKANGDNDDDEEILYLGTIPPSKPHKEEIHKQPKRRKLETNDDLSQKLDCPDIICLATNKDTNMESESKYLAEVKDGNISGNDSNSDSEQSELSRMISETVVPVGSSGQKSSLKEKLDLNTFPPHLHGKHDYNLTIEPRCVDIDDDHISITKDAEYIIEGSCHKEDFGENSSFSDPILSRTMNEDTSLGANIHHKASQKEVTKSEYNTNCQNGRKEDCFANHPHNDDLELVSTEKKVDSRMDTNEAPDDIVSVDEDSHSADLNSKIEQEETNSPRKDVCFICGSDLSRISTGVRGRVAHMKRCSAKYGVVLGGSSRDVDADLDSDFVESGAETAKAPTNAPSSLTKQSSRKTKNRSFFNPYNKDQWHDGAETEFDLEMSGNGVDICTKQPAFDAAPRWQQVQQKQQKQTMLNHFFQSPVRSLTSVLMAGSRRLAKGAEVAASKKNFVPTSGGGRTNGGGGGGRWKRRTGQCPAHKRIPGTDFVCDGFLYARSNLSQNYFLTHFHSDHYGGITKQWHEGTIYCSLPTANLVNQQLGVDKRYLHPVPMMTPTVIISRNKPVTVTLLNANHCPGAVMFLFEVGNRKILHVGDFRWNRELMMRMPPLRDFSNLSPRLDEIFLDTTYCAEKYTLPTQEEAILAAIEVAKNEITVSRKERVKTLFLFGSYTIGKEKIYLSVAEHLNMKVYVDKRRYRILSALEWSKERMQMLTTNKSETNLWVVPLGQVNFKHMRGFMEEANKNKVFSKPYGRVAGFRPTGWTYSGKPGSKLISSKTNGRYSVHGVPYSEHSSFPELVDCLKCLKPKKITTTVSPSKNEQQCDLLLNAVRAQAK